VLYCIMTTNKKTFDDLEFKRHAVKADAVQARLDLGNDLEISVVAMKDKDQSLGGLYGNASKGTYEVAMFHNDSMLPLAKYDDVLGWQDEIAITRLMGEAQKNGLAWVKLLQEIRDEHRKEFLKEEE